MEKLFKAWRWNRAPELGDIYKNSNSLLRLFKFRESLVAKTVWRLNNLMSQRGILVAGHPGVGKTTFLRYMAEKEFPESMYIISLAERMGGIQPILYAKLSEEQLLHIFSGIESFLLEIISKAGSSPTLMKTSVIKEKYYRDDKHLPIEEITRDILLPLCQQIQRMPHIPKYFLIIDDVDYIFPRDQCNLLNVVCDIINVTANPIIIYSARPIAAGIATNHLKTHIAHHFGPPIIVEPIDVCDVIRSRFEDVAVGEVKTFGPFEKEEEKIKQIITPLSNYNLRAGLNIAESAVLSAEEFAEKPGYQYNYNSLISALYGTRSPSITSQSDIDNVRHIQNIFRAVDINDPVPFDYVTLLTFSEPIKIDEKLLELFNKNCMIINPINTPKSGYSKKEILHHVHSAREHDFIRRYQHSSNEDFLAIDSHQVVRTLWNYKFCLTPKGEVLLNLSTNEYYQHLSALKTWRQEVQTNIKKITPKTKTVDMSILKFQNDEN